eukprot:GEMP01017123.1.p1 GENE.GEMP01017123.1~~GEMP01017123.1.p1  ORF type:complete len:417 (+),score=64.14 GEMP01017123.1:61-1311(+)
MWISIHAVLILCFVWFGLIEPLFYIVFLWEVEKGQAMLEPPKMSVQQRDWLLAQLLAHCDMRQLIREWFSPKLEKITRSNMRDLFAWAFFTKYLGELEPAEVAWLEEAIDETCQQGGITCSEGDDDERIMRYTHDPVVVHWLPLCFYVFMAALNYGAHLGMKLIGFTRFTSSAGVRYWYREQYRDEDELLVNSPAMVFFHGLGIGIVSYIALLRGDIKASKQFVFDNPSISINPFAIPVRKKPFLQAVLDALERHKTQKAIIVGHSFGSIHASWVVQGIPDIVQRVVLIDPVSLLLCLPCVARNYLYQEFTGLAGKYHGMICMELGISRAMRRHFWWTESVLFPNMLPPESVVVLAEYDYFIPTKEIYLSICDMSDKSVQAAVIPKIGHGRCLFDAKALRLLVDAINGVKLNEADL